ncbi:hypothetical protein J2S10_003293 [Neobacillus ginsengisoli]|uniref:Uncharacterized protein n=1 Tax=Neobacillus ginsengisoli TaxID=904295 RepID=A0ABT9XX12_9BACI|nr:hypothetical protein [Neobacillus ginsengisoli]
MVLDIEIYIFLINNAKFIDIAHLFRKKHIILEKNDI